GGGFADRGRAGTAFPGTGAGQLPAEPPGSAWAAVTSPGPGGGLAGSAGCGPLPSRLDQAGIASPAGTDGQPSPELTGLGQSGSAARAADEARVGAAGPGGATTASPGPGGGLAGSGGWGGSVAGG